MSRKNIFFLFVALFFMACNAQESQKAAVTNVSWDQAVQMQKAGAVFLDVRTPPELAQGYVAGALNVPLQELDKRYTELPKDKKLLVYCRSGHRSAKASAFLVTKGLLIYNVEGGFLAAPPESVLPRAYKTAQ